MTTEKLIPLATLKIEYNEEFYKVVDFLNRNLKDKKIMFGLSKEENEAVLTIYEY